MSIKFQFLFRYPEIIFLSTCLAGIFLGSCPFWAEDKNFLAELVQSARQKRLAEQTAWHVLLHYKSQLLFQSMKALSMGMLFYWPTGKGDPEVELEATLASFFQQKEAGAQNFGNVASLPVTIG